MDPACHRPAEDITIGSGLSLTGTTLSATGGGGDTITSPNGTLNVGGSSSNTTLDLAGAAGKMFAGRRRHLRTRRHSASTARTFKISVTRSTAPLPSTPSLALRPPRTGHSSYRGLQAGPDSPYRPTDRETPAGSHTRHRASKRGRFRKTSFALTSGDDSVSFNSCYNHTGQPWTITSVICLTDAGSNTTTINPTFGADGTGTTLQ